MKVFRLRLATLLIATAMMSLSIAEDDVRIAYSEPLQNVRLSTSDPFSTRKIGGPVQSFQFEAFSKRFEFRLLSNRALLGPAQQNLMDTDIGIYRGDMAGVPDSWVRLVFVDGIPRGLFWDGQEMYAIEADDNAGSSIIYRLKDVEIPAGALSCSHVAAVGNGATLFKAIAREMSAVSSSGPGATSQLDMAIIADFEYTSAKGASIDADLIARMNNVDGIFSSQLGVQLNVNRIDTFQNANDPFTDETDSSVLIDELADFRNTTPTQNANGLSHLFTGRDLDGTTVGIAFGSAICSRRFGAGLTQGSDNLTIDSLVAAHEIGHNFGAPHDGTSGSNCESEPQTFLMAPSINGSDEFSSCSISEMQAVVAAASCLSALPSTDVAIVSGTQPSATLLGNSATITFAVNSVGTNSANNVTIDITLPSAVSLTTVSADAGTCTSGAASASCSIGTIAAGSGVNVSLVVDAVSIGTADFVATIAASIDANINNNQATTQLVVNPAVDLVLAADVTRQVDFNQSVAIRTSVENRSALVATGVTVTVTPDAGLRIDSASWSPGTCSVDTGIATCQAATLAVQSINSLDLQITGTSEGNLSYAMSVTVNEADRDTSNNSASGQVTVGAVVSNTPNDDSGGGAVGFSSLLILVLTQLVFWRRQRAALHGQ